MEKEFKFRISDEYGVRYNARVEVELDKNEYGQPVFSACAFIDKGRTTIMGGQCLDEIANNYNFVKEKDKPHFLIIYNMWIKHHLNHLNAGTEAQENALSCGFDEWCEETGIEKLEYKHKCLFLESMDLYKDKNYLVKEKGKIVPYRYGSGWIYRAIPENDLETIKEILR